MLEIRPPTDDDREELAEITGLAFNFRSNPEDLTLDGVLCVVDRGRLVASSTGIPFRQWFGGRQVACAGIGGVVVVPEYRGRGVATTLIRETLGAERRRGQAVSALYPANAGLYRKLGYEYGGLMNVHTVPMGDVPRRAGLVVREAEPAETSLLMSCFSRYLSAHNGPVETDDETHFSRWFLAHKGEGTHQRTVLLESATTAVEGFASYFTGEAGHGRYRVTCKQFVSLTPAALSGLLNYFNRFENAAKELAWYGPPGDSLMGLALSSNAFSITTEYYRWMERLLDVPASLSSRGYLADDIELVLEINDPLFPENSGPWLLQVKDGKAEVTATDGPGLQLGIGVLSALYTGYACPADLVLLGSVNAEEPELQTLGALFSGPPPWCPHFF